MTASRTLTMSLIVLLFLHIVVLLASLVAPYDAATQFRDYSFAPPTRIHFVDRSGHFHLRPFVYQRKTNGEFAKYEEDATRVAPLHFFIRDDGYSVVRFFHARLHLFGVNEPAHVFLFGTDGYGRDQFSRFLFGGQISLFSGLLAAGLSLVLGLLLGSAAGYHGGLLDGALMRATEVFAALPWLYLLLALRAFLPLHLSPAETFFLLIAVIGLLGWSRPARLVRGIVLSAKERNYVIAARGFGASEGYLLRRHVLPHTRAVMLTQAAVLIPQYILAEVTLSFLGLGVADPVPSWGNMLSALQEYSVLTSYWWMIIPGVLLIPVFLTYYFLAHSVELRVGSQSY